MPTPSALCAGDLVAVVSPCGPVLDHEVLGRSLELVRSWGLAVVEGRNARAGMGHLAGSDQQRAADLNDALRDPTVRAVWVTRGGSGLARLLHRVDWDALSDHPTLLVGFSDVTALLVSAWQRTGMVSVHGHVVGRLAEQPPAAVDVVRSILFGTNEPVTLEGTALPGVAPTTAEGPLIGGNLTVLATLAGTPDALRARGCVLLLEEVGEAPYRVDRALTQLRRSGALDGVAGIAVGMPVACAVPATRPSATFDAVLADRLGDLGVPVVTGLPLGHIAEQHAVLHGAPVRLDGAHGTLTSATRLASRR